jgi:hypothetical protein
MFMSRRGAIACAAASIAVLTAGSPAEAQTGLLDRLQIHGYLTQGYVTSSDLPIFGIPTDGTADYRNAALQFRYGLSQSDNVVLQFNHRRLGNSVLTQQGSDVELSWAFYQHRFGGNASVRIGRVPMPGGIFNETRDVGTLLPFYRAPGNFYMEGIETIDGVTGTLELPFGDWSFESHASYGGFGIEIPIMTPEGAQLYVDRIEGLSTYQGWLNTPLYGVRVGGSGMHWSDETQGGDVLGWSASVDADRERFFVRGEYRNLDLNGTRLSNYYAQGGVRLGRVGVNGQADFADTQVDTPIGELRYQGARDLAVGLSFSHTPLLVYKLEAHRAKGSTFDTFIDPMGPKAQSDYFIGSVSVSF